jgi:hypothetical protein
MQKRWIILLLGVGIGVAGYGQGNPPGPVKTKTATEAVDPKAEYEHGRAIPVARTAERLDFFYRAARAGYAPAQEELGNYFSTLSAADKQQQAAHLRESVRWSSRAAYQGVYTAQLRIAQCYRKGEVLPKDRVNAFVWMRVAIDHSPFGIIYRGSLDELTKEMSPTEIGEAEAKAKAFELKTAAGMNPVEADMVFAQLKFGGTRVVDRVHQVVLNDVGFAQGETKELKLGEDAVRIVCFSIDEKSVLVGIAGTPYVHWLKR